MGKKRQAGEALEPGTKKSLALKDAYELLQEYKTVVLLV